MQMDLSQLKEANGKIISMYEEFILQQNEAIQKNALEIAQLKVKVQEYELSLLRTQISKDTDNGTINSQKAEA